MMHGVQRCVGSDVIYTERRGQSQKPEEIYQLIEESWFQQVIILLRPPLKAVHLHIL